MTGTTRMTDAFNLWRERHPEEHLADPDPHDVHLCLGCRSTFAWRGYDGLCGWCYDDMPAQPTRHSTRRTR